MTVGNSMAIPGRGVLAGPDPVQPTPRPLPASRVEGSEEDRKATKDKETKADTRVGGVSLVREEKEAELRAEVAQRVDAPPETVNLAGPLGATIDLRA